MAVSKKVLLNLIGEINPTSIDDYIARGGYEALKRVVTSMKPEAVIEEMKKSNLRGRGGAAFPTGIKWEATRNASGEPKTIICNADEGEPGNFKDRTIMEGNPHSIVEGVAIAGYAVGAPQGYIYIRGEYKESIEKLQKAVADAKKKGFLGKNILGSAFNYETVVFKGAGAYVCGEETALIESLEGRRGESMVKPPYPPTHGLWGAPTVINNVETLANVPLIIKNGADWFNGIGTEKSKGTKIFTPCGNVKKPGAYEVPLGVTLREVLYDLAGGTESGKPIKAVLIGGPSGVCVGKASLDKKLAYEDLPPGAGALIVIEEGKCILDVIHNCLKFFVHESCGQCIPCREGTKRMFEITTGWRKGRGKAGEIELMQELADIMSTSARCGLGQFAGTAFTTSYGLFADEYISHAVKKKCPSGVCPMTDREGK